MLGIAAAIAFGAAFLINATDTVVDRVFSPTSLMLLGLTLLAAHLAGVGTGYTPRRRSRR
ncbi:hypothetical protein [Streptacidiphilus cavernicola]|uniref:Uncharacterized protein n=1 Tax=Streptacidiphilus cavernicola TaxID=3342716 RepID=A0ABV6VPM1_9ACTN